VEGNAIAECLNELADLKEVWEAVMKPYDVLEEIKETLWTSAVMRKIRRSLDDLLVEMRALPNRIRQYDAYTQLHGAVKGYIGGHGMLTDLKTEALKERHWKTILAAPRHSGGLLRSDCWNAVGSGRAQSEKGNDRDPHCCSR
jgi:dynein heavy chain 1